MAQHDVEITISKTGDVKVHIEGVKGKACMEYAKWLTDVIGRVKDRQLTSEYYEPEVKSRIDLHQDLKVDDGSAGDASGASSRTFQVRHGASVAAASWRRAAPSLR